MRWVGIIGLAAALLSAHDAHAEEVGEASPTDSPSKDLSRELEDLVTGAIADGLLTPTEAEVSEPTETDRRWATCPSHSALDLSAFKNIETYADYTTFRSAFPDDEASLDQDARLSIAAAQTAALLLAEARRTLSSDNSKIGDLMRAYLAILSESDSADEFDTAIFDCLPSGPLWRAAHALNAGEPGGAEMLAVSIPQFRQMPIRVRARLLQRLAVPLEARGEELLVRQLIADFTPEDNSRVSAAVHAQAFLEFGTQTDYLDTAEIRALISHSPYREAIAAKIVREDLYPGKAFLDRLVHEITEAAKRKDARAKQSLEALLGLLARQSDYAAIFDFAKNEEVQDPESQAMIGQALADTMLRDLESEDVARIVAAADAIGRSSEIQLDIPQAEELLELATEKAAENGFGALVLRLADNIDVMNTEQANRFAALAFNRDSYGQVLAIGARADASVETLILAAYSAMATGAEADFQAIEQRLLDRPEALLTLAETELAQNVRFLSQEAFARMAVETDPAFISRHERVIALRRAQKPGGEPTPARSGVADVKSVFADADRLLSNSSLGGS